jgi:hypothetical protein
VQHDEILSHEPGYFDVEVSEDGAVERVVLDIAANELGDLFEEVFARPSQTSF